MSFIVKKQFLSTIFNFHLNESDGKYYIKNVPIERNDTFNFVQKYMQENPQLKNRCFCVRFCDDNILYVVSKSSTLKEMALNHLNREKFSVLYRNSSSIKLCTAITVHDLTSQFMVDLVNIPEYKVIFMIDDDADVDDIDEYYDKLRESKYSTFNSSIRD